MNNIKHKPGGGDKKIFDDKDYLRQMAPSATGGSGTQVNNEKLYKNFNLIIFGFTSQTHCWKQIAIKENSQSYE